MTPSADRVRVLNNRELNRATLERQMLLERVSRPALEIVDLLAGMQAQEPLDPYLGLWSRLEGFRPDELADLLLDRRVVRATLMRGTIHLVTASDFFLLRPFVQSLVARTYRRAFGAGIKGVGIDEVEAACVEILREEPRTRGELRRVLAERWPQADAEAMSFMLYAVPLIQTTPRGVWGRTGPARWALADQWLAGNTAPAGTVDDIVLRYLGAFGPATVADARQWSGVSGLKEVFERLRPQLVIFRDPSGRELFDLPDAPRPDPDIPAPPRFLPQFDNVFLSHEDRSRMSPEPFGSEMTNIWNAIGTGKLAGRGQSPVSWSMFLLDGYLSGTWKIEKEEDRATLIIQPMVKFNDADGQALAEEGSGLLGLLAGDTDPGGFEVRFV